MAIFEKYGVSLMITASVSRFIDDFAAGWTVSDRHIDAAVIQIRAKVTHIVYPFFFGEAFNFLSNL